MVGIVIVPQHLNLIEEGGAWRDLLEIKVHATLTSGKTTKALQ